MANKHLSRSAKGIDLETWYFEEPHGIEIIHVEPHETEKLKVTKHFKISWRALRGALARKDRKL